jgi:HPt (histidine-containing phosphotransfer) domain-containing protein
MVKPSNEKTRVSDDVARNLDALWKQYLPTILGRIETISAAAQARNVSSEDRLQAAMEAHKLAGSLGTFGLRSASDAALEIESMFASAASPDKTQLARVEELVARIRNAVANR